MEAKTDLQTYLEQGRVALAQGRGRDAAIAYAYGAQIEGENPAIHLGLAEANLALGNYEVVDMACRKVLELQPEGGIESELAQALLDVRTQHYESALKHTDNAIQSDPGLAYAHALRSFLLRALGQDYDGNLARARAMRLSYGGRFENCFPVIEREKAVAETPASTTPSINSQSSLSERPQVMESEQNWKRPNNMQRRLIRWRFAMSQRPGIVTNTIIGVTVIMTLIGNLLPSILLGTVQISGAIMMGEIWRVITGIFIYPIQLQGMGIFSIAIGMLSLWFIGRATEALYGPTRYLIIYILCGMLSALFAIVFQMPLGLGPSGGLLGGFGAIGLFYIVRRNELGALGNGALTSWLFWLLLNMAFAFQGGIGSISVYLATLASGMIISYFFLRSARSNRF